MPHARFAARAAHLEALCAVPVAVEERHASGHKLGIAAEAVFSQGVLKPEMQHAAKKCRLRKGVALQN